MKIYFTKWNFTLNFKLETQCQTVWILIRQLLQKLSDLDLHCLQKTGISVSRLLRVKTMRRTVWPFWNLRWRPTEVFFMADDCLTLNNRDTDISVFCKQCRSRSDSFWRSCLIRIHTVCHCVSNLKFNVKFHLVKYIFIG